VELRNILFGVGGAMVAVALVALALEVRRPSRASVDEAALDRALAQHESGRAPAGQRAPAIPQPSRGGEARPERAAGRGTPVRERPTEPDPDQPTPPIATIAPRVAPQLSDLPDPASADITELMDVATRYYDRGDYQTAEEIAVSSLERFPQNIKMLRIVVSTSCIMGNETQARGYYEQLPARDQRDMKRRCTGWGIEL
jgi:hypothetical protein